MIELVAALPSGPGARLVLRPRRALSAGQFAGLFASLSLATFGVAGYAFAQGNVFAPVFALLDAAFIAAVLRWVWRQGDRYEEIALDERQLEVRRSAQAEPAFRAHPYWVRLSVDGGEGRERVLLGSQGRQVEVGAFLSNEERRDLAVQLEGLLASASGRGRNENHTLG
ncbi:DUF2244 domain-containing protein [Arenimonas sp.]|uniref:DUF2244 domain-containing protein n=1 Tax=Arenimonas sp. TaxID=1872635 RepID=UPI002E2FA11A|nr:DUF2244 domain-containing protein [Arenimonas sp.]HEX4852928.1 DUF2244 domain-containing protein [Arenimonas sp.]